MIITLSADKLKPGMVTANYVTAFDEKGIDITITRPEKVLTEQIIGIIKKYRVQSIDIIDDETKNQQTTNKSYTLDQSHNHKQQHDHRVTSGNSTSRRTNVTSGPASGASVSKKPSDDKLSSTNKLSATNKPNKVPQIEAPPIKAPPIVSIIDETQRDEAVDGIRNLFGLIGSGVTENMTTAYQVVKQLDNIVDQLVETISTESDSLVHIADLKSYDEYTYHHSLSVAVLSIAIGEGMGLDMEKLKLLGQSAMMHDIGKTNVPAELINKPGKLTDEEFSVVKKHAEDSGKYLKQSLIGNNIIWNSVTHHHEKYDGSGYPKGLKSDKIPLFSRIIAVADVYDALTSFRPYRNPMLPSEAVELVMSEVGRSFEYDVVVAFIEKLELYPVNSVVQLSDGRVGVVHENTHSMRPVLKMQDDTLLDLMALDNLSLVIVKVF